MALCGELLLEEAERLRLAGAYDAYEDAIPGPSTSKFTFNWPSHRPHPLLIPDIARNILSKVSIKDAENCRKICRSWNEESCKVLQDKKLVALLQIEAVKFYNDKMGNTKHFPHSQFELHMEHANESNATMKTFWTTFGSHIKFLELKEGVMLLSSLFQLLSERITSLERLTLMTLPRRVSAGRISHQNHDQVQVRPVINHRFFALRELNLGWCPQDEVTTKSVVKEMFRAMPNLETLSLRDIPAGYVMRDGIDSRTLVSGLLVQILTDPDVHLPHLRKINFPIEAGNVELELLTQKRFQFENLHLKLKEGVKNSTLKNFLSKFSQHLFTLEVVFPDNFFLCGVTFPAYFLMKSAEAILHLQQVKQLTLINFQGPLSFVRNLKKLEILTVNNANFSPETSTPPRVLQVFDAWPAVSNGGGNEHQLVKFQTNSTMESWAVNTLSECFPLLRILHVNGIDDDGLGVIYRNLPFLVELQVTAGRCTDQGLSGVALKVCDDMAETVTYLSAKPDKYRSDLFLGSLPYLKTLYVCSETVTDVSIVFGIVECKSLENLTLQSPMITDTGVMEIANRMRTTLKSLNVVYCENVSEAGKYYVKEKLIGVQLILEPNHLLQRVSKPENRNRQVGFALRERNSGPVMVDPETDAYDPFSDRNRMVAELQRRRLQQLNLEVANFFEPPVLFQQLFNGNDVPPQAQPQQLPMARNVLLPHGMDTDNEDNEEDDEDNDYNMEAEERLPAPPSVDNVPFRDHFDPDFHIHEDINFMVINVQGQRQLGPRQNQDPAPGAI